MKSKTFILIFLVLLFSNCEKVIDVDLNVASPSIVIEATLTNSNNLVQVLISKTGSYFGSNSIQTVSNATVLLEDDTGREFELIEVKSGIYQSMRKINPMPGRKYKIMVTSEGETYEAESMLNYPVEIETLTSNYTEGYSFLRSGYNVNLYFQDPETIRNYYRLKIYVNGKSEELDNDFIIFDDENINGQYIELRIRRKIFDLGDKVSFELVSLDKGAFEYFNSLQELISVNPGSTAPANPTSNFSNGALGYFSAFSSDRKTIVIEK